MAVWRYGEQYVGSEYKPPSGVSDTGGFIVREPTYRPTALPPYRQAQHQRHDRGDQPRGAEIDGDARGRRRAEPLQHLRMRFRDPRLAGLQRLQTLGHQPELGAELLL